MRLLLTLTLLVAGIAAQTSKPTTPAAAWPKLDAKVNERVKTLYENLGRHEEELTKKSEQELVTIGSGAAPYLINKLVDFPANVNDSLRRVLDQTTTREHAALIAGYAREKRATLRLWVTERLATFADPAMAPILKNALKDKDKEIAYRGALGMLALGDQDAIEPVLARCAQEWTEVGEMTLKIVAPGRRSELGTALLKQVDSDDTKVKLAALKLLRALGTKENSHGIAVHLDSEDHAVKKESINALRVLVDGQPALEQLSVFEEIEMAKEWKKRL